MKFTHKGEDKMENTKNDNLNDEPLVPENHGPFGDYYVHPAKIRRSQELRDALKALES
jgi:hypothetical protein